MDFALQLANVALTGLLALERGAKHCGFLSGVKRLDCNCGSCFGLNISRNASNAWEPTDIPNRRESYSYEPRIPPSAAVMDKGSPAAV